MSPASVFGPDVLVVLVLLVYGLAVPVWGVVDAASRPAGAFAAARSNKTMWIAAIVVAWLVGLGFFLAGFYLLFTRPKVRRHMEPMV